MKNIESVFELYIKRMISKSAGNIREYKYRNDDFAKKTKDIFDKSDTKRDHNNYTQYLLSEDFQKIYDKFEKQVKHMISSMLSTSNQFTIYTCIALGAVFVLQIIIFIR